MSKIDFIIKDKEKYNFSLDVKKVEIYPEVKSLEVTPTKELQIHKPDNCYGYNKVKVNPIPDEYIKPSGTLDITENGITDVTNYSKVDVNVETIIPEDLTEELSTYNSSLSIQESLINSIIETLNSRK